mmetsp:Transcript_27543/g.66968  ORF Transcript_27543/g.66968 Transcript_27543/m.66968 type:complete len:432 (+) Transcript_27543:86-1381(+)
MASTEEVPKTEEAAPEAASGGEGAGPDTGKSKRVYVGNLAWQVDWRDLKDLFKTVGHDVTRADVMQTRDGRSKGCGIVEFATVEGAKQAVLTLNDTELKGRQIFVREDREEQSAAASTSRGAAPNSGATGTKFSSDDQAQTRRVYVGNLSWEVQWQELKDHMKSVGNVVHAEVICEHNGRSKGCGVVEYATAEEAQKAIETLTQTELKGRMIFVREDREGSSAGAGAGGDGAAGGNKKDAAAGGNASVYVWNLSYETDWRSLKDHMRKAGNVDNATVLTNQEGRSNGCAVVVYQKAQEAARAIRELQDSDLDGRSIRLREDRGQGGGGGGGGRGHGGRGRGRGGRGGGRSRGGGDAEGKQIFISNISSDTDWRKVKDHFKQVGDVDRADSRPGKFATVRFYNKEDAAKAIETMNGSELDGCTLEIRLDQKA